MTRKIIASDLHLGSHRNRVKKFAEFLREEPKKTQIILLGDIFDDFKKRRMSADDFAVLSALLEFENILACDGNHDLNFESRKKFLPNKTIYFPGTYLQHQENMVMTHGHCWDSCPEWLARVGDKFYDQFLKFGPQAFSGVKKFFKAPCVKNVQKNAERLINSKRYENIDYIVTGHIHQQMEVKFEGGSYICCGCFVEEESFAIWQDGKISLVRL